MLVKKELQSGHFQSAKGGQLHRLLHLEFISNWFEQN